MPTSRQSRRWAASGFRLLSENYDRAVNPPSDPGLQPSRRVGAQGGRSADALAAVLPGTRVDHTPGARVVGRILRPQYVASPPLFPGVLWAFNRGRHRLSYASESLRESTSGSANGVDGRGDDRACGRVRCGGLRVKGVVTCSGSCIG